VVIAMSAALASFLLPALVAARRRGMADVASLYHWSSRWNLVIVSPALALMLVVPSALLVTLFGGRYAIVAGPARILGAAATAQVLFGFNGLTLDACGLPRVLMLRSLAGVVISLVCCPVLITAFGLTGAASATTIAILFVNVTSSWALWRHFHILPWSNHSAMIAAAFTVSLAVGWALVALTAPSNIGRCAIVASCTAVITLASAFAGGDWRDVPLLSGKARPWAWRNARWTSSSWDG
jgi:O-antigen/teichoic acid export membrane protein